MFTLRRRRFVVPSAIVRLRSYSRPSADKPPSFGRFVYADAIACFPIQQACDRFDHHDGKKRYVVQTVVRGAVYG